MVSHKKAKLYQRYPAASVLTYNGSTVLHFLLGGIGIALGYSFAAWAGYLFGVLYLVLALAEMYVLMPLSVCPNCVYYRMSGAVCIAGLNVISRKVARAGDARDFPKMACLHCHAKFKCPQAGAMGVRNL